MTLKAQTKRTASRVHHYGPRCAAKGTSCYTSPRRESRCARASFACTDCELPVCLWQVGRKRPKICSTTAQTLPGEQVMPDCSHWCEEAGSRSDRVTHCSQSFMHDTCLPTLTGLHGLCEPRSTSLLSVIPDCDMRFRSCVCPSVRVIGRCRCAQMQEQCAV